MFCPSHGRVYLTVDEYARQMNRPNARWECPRFETDPPETMGLCGRTSNFDDDTFEASLEPEPTAEQPTE